MQYSPFIANNHYWKCTSYVCAELHLHYTQKKERRTNRLKWNRWNAIQTRIKLGNESVSFNIQINQIEKFRRKWLLHFISVCELLTNFLYNFFKYDRYFLINSQIYSLLNWTILNHSFDVQVRPFIEKAIFLCFSGSSLLVTRYRYLIV